MTLTITVDATPFGQVLWMVDAPDHTVELELTPDQAVALGQLLLDRAVKARQWDGTPADAEEP